MKKWCIVDRIEGDMAVVEFGRRTFDIPLELLPTGVKEGDVLTFRIEQDEPETKRRKQEIEELAKNLFIEE